MLVYFNIIDLAIRTENYKFAKKILELLAKLELNYL